MRHLIYCLFVVFIANIAAVRSQSTTEQLQNEPMIFKGCGIDYIIKSQKITNRDKDIIFPDLYEQGTNFPIEFEIDELPNECYKIHKAYIWMTYSNGKIASVNPPLNAFEFSVLSPNGNIDTLMTEIVAQDEGTKWGDNYKLNHRLDVTNIFKNNGKYSINTPNASSTDFMYFLDGMALLIVYQRYDSDYQGHLVLNDGLGTSHFNKTSNDYPKCDSVTYKMKGIDICETTSDTRSFIVIADLQGYDNLNDYEDCKVWLDLNGTKKKIIRKFWNYETTENFTLAQGQTQYTFFFEPTQGLRVVDFFSVPLMGVYYRTKNCDNVPCDSTFQTTITPSSDEICPGEAVTLNASIPEEYANEQIKYYWTSIPEGTNLEGQSIVVSPSEATVFKLHAILGNDCLFSHSEIRITLSTPPIADAGEDVKICGNMVAVLGKAPSLGVPPYTYEWFPNTGLSATDTLHPSVQNISSETQYILKVTDAHGCVGYDTVLVSPYILPIPEIQVNGDVSICHCDSVEIKAIANFAAYLWSNGETTQSIFVNEPGTYSVTVTDSNGCSNSSEPITITTFEPNTTVSLNDTLIYAKPGEVIEIPLKIKSIDNFEECGLRSYIAKISFDRSVLVPVNGTPFGIINEPIRTITFNGNRNNLDTLLTTLKLETVLGKYDYVQVKLDTFAWIECSGAVRRIDSAVKIIDLCYEGGTRLFNSDKLNSSPPKIRTNSQSNSVTITFGIFERCFAQLYISDMLGRVMKTFNYPDIDSGSYELELNVSDYPPGVYVCTLKVGNEVYNQIMRITN